MAETTEKSILLFVPAFVSRLTTEPGELVVAANGSGSRCVAAYPCSLAKAMEKIRALNRAGGLTRDMTVSFKGGLYALKAPLTLTPFDSGTNGYTITWAPYRGQRVVLSGGFTVDNWILHDAARGIYRARVPAWADFRQLWVNGRRAIRARGLEGATFLRTATGFMSSASGLEHFSSLDGVELVGFNEWRSFRCGVDVLSGASIILEQPCWENATGPVQPDDGFTTVARVENAYELLDEPGEWYLDRGRHVVYYMPRPGEDMTGLSVIAPRLQTLLAVNGTAHAPVQNLIFSGLIFSHANWSAPSGRHGYAPLQAGFHYTGAGQLTRTPAAVTFRRARHLRVQGNTFSHLGGAGLSVRDGSQQVYISGNRFEDIASSALQIGDIDDASAPAARQNRNISVIGNSITAPGQDYHDGVGIFAGYVRDTVIENNELSDLPYTGISVGWGWGVHSYAANNRIIDNWIENAVSMLEDGGAIYTLGPQPNSEISGNYICMQRGRYGTLYLDQGSSGFSIYRNVFSHVGDTWLYLWYHDIHDNHAWCNFTDNMSCRDDGFANSIETTTLVKAGSWPAEAVAIMDEAGTGAGRSRSSFCRQVPEVLLVEDDTAKDESGSRRQMAAALYTGGIPFVNWDTEGGYNEPGRLDLHPFTTVVWDAGQGEAWEAGPADDAALTSWLESGGKKLFMASKTYHHLVSGALRAEYFNLHQSIGYSSASRLEVINWLGSGEIALQGAVNTLPISGGSDNQTVFRDGLLSLGTSYDAEGYKTVYWAFPFDQLADPAEQALFMDRILSW